MAENLGCFADMVAAMIRRSWQLLMDWLFATQPLFPPSTDASRDRSLAGKARVKARRVAARQLRQLL